MLKLNNNPNKYKYYNKYNRNNKINCKKINNLLMNGLF